jgi:hypothetical protein
VSVSVTFHNCIIIGLVFVFAPKHCVGAASITFFAIDATVNGATLTMVSEVIPPALVAIMILATVARDGAIIQLGVANGALHSQQVT